MLTREEAVAFILTWKDTPYVRAGRIRGAGVDCGTLLAEYLVGIGSSSREQMDEIISGLGFLSNDWFCHADAEKYEALLRAIAPVRWQGICRGTIPAKPGDLALFRVVGSSLYNHGSVLLSPTRAVHAVTPKVAEMRPTLHPMTAFTEMAIFDPWGKV